MEQIVREATVYRFTEGGVDFTLPRVSAILNAIFPIQIDPARLELARQRGTAVHRALELLDGGGDGSGLDMGTVDPMLLPYITAYQRFLSDTGFVPLLIEAPVRSLIFGFVGTLDRQGPLNGKPAVVDLKTGMPSQLHALQNAAYERALAEQVKARSAGKRFALYLKNDGTYRLNQHKDPDDFKRFLSCLTLYHWLQKGGPHGNGTHP